MRISKFGANPPARRCLKISVQCEKPMRIKSRWCIFEIWPGNGANSCWDWPIDKRFDRHGLRKGSSLTSRTKCWGNWAIVWPPEFLKVLLTLLWIHQICEQKICCWHSPTFAPTHELLAYLFHSRIFSAIPLPKSYARCILSLSYCRIFSTGSQPTDWFSDESWWFANVQIPKKFNLSYEISRRVYSFHNLPKTISPFWSIPTLSEHSQKNNPFNIEAIDDQFLLNNETSR
jgi:hypothetical protein